ncbi:MAG TPA: hypothetical protein VF530_19770 [Planctomycetota bacterium]
MKVLLFVLALLPALGLGLCAWRLLRRPRAASFAGRLVQSIGVVALAGLGGALYQALFLAMAVMGMGISRVFLGTLPLSWWILTGGWTVQQVFEATVEDVTGHRRDTFLDNGHYYLALTAVQTLLVAALVARRERGSFRGDPLAWLVFLLALANALAGVPWPWWGT